MIEPEMAFADLNTYLETAEAMTRYVIRYLLDNCPDELAFFNQFFDKGLIERLELVAGSDFARVTYTDAIELLKKNNDNFQYQSRVGHRPADRARALSDRAGVQEAGLCHRLPQGDQGLLHAPERGRQDRGRRWICLVPGIGELIGGSQREERLDVLTARIKELGMDPADYDWYLDLRRFGSAEACRLRPGL